MRSLRALLALLLFAAGLGVPAIVAASGGREALAPALNSIAPEDVQRHGRYLASAELEGRDTPKRGLDLAADYIAGELERYGLEPGGTDGSWFQRFDLDVTVPDESCGLELETRGGAEAESSWKLHDDFVPLWGSADGEASGDVVFAGYGITAPDERYDDYAGRKVPGKIALVLTHEPRETTKGAAFKGTAVTDHSSFLSKAKNAEQHGAVGLLVVTDPLNHTDTSPNRFQFPSMRNARPSRPEQQVSIPMMHVSLAVAEAILGQEIWVLQEKLDASMKGRLVPAQNGRVTMRAAFRQATARPRNVIAVYPGSDPQRSSEAVVLGAHYDHVGVNDRGEIHFGADDNASGTAGLLEVAEALSIAKPSVNRQIILIWFAAEEVGLLGSQAYVKNPTVPLDKTVAMLNVDMIGRVEPTAIAAISRTKSPHLFGIAERLARSPSVGLRVKSTGEEFFKRSDHYNFYKAGVPALFFFGGDHEDYHKPSDTFDKIDAKKVTRVARLLLLVALDVANNPTPPQRPKPE
jgi:hypothetical protein